MSGSSYDKTIQFRAGAEKEAAEVLDEVHIQYLTKHPRLAVSAA